MSSLMCADFVYVIEGYNEVPHMDYQLELKPTNGLPNNRLLLDCQSFINGFHSMNYVENTWRDIWFIMLSGNDCEQISIFSRQTIDESGPFCLFINPEEQTIDVSAHLPDCQ